MQINRRRHSVATTLLALAISMSGCSMVPSIESSIAAGNKALIDGELDKAEQNFQRATADAKSSDKKEQLAIAKIGLADTYVAQENYDDAETLYTDALEIIGDRADKTTERVYHGLGKLNLKRQTYALAEKYLNKSLKLQAELPEPDALESARLQSDLGEFYLAKGNSALAKQSYEESLEFLDNLKSKQYNLQTQVMEKLAQIAKDEKDLDAQEDYRRRLTNLQLGHAKKTMTVLPWVNNKHVKADDNDEESDSEPAAEPAKDSENNAD